MQTAVNRLTFAVAAAALVVAVLSFGAQFAGAQHGAAPGTFAAVPGLMSYQGRVLAGGSPYNGTGFFKFAIVNAAANVSFWSNNGSSSGGSEPSVAVPVTVSNGLFTVLLGDTLLSGMTQPLSATVFADADRRLRIWFSQTNSGFTQLLPDQPLTAAPFAFNAQALGGLDASTYLQQPAADARYARINPTTEQIALLKWYTSIGGTQADFGVGSHPHAVAFDGANMWVANASGNSVSVLRASDGFHVMTPTVGSSLFAIAFDGANMWVANAGGGSVSVLRASDGSLVRTVSVGATPVAIGYDGTNMWVANYTENTVSVLRASDGLHVVTTTVGGDPYAVAFDGANMWVANQDNTVSVLRASDGFHVMTPTVSGNPDAIAFDAANMWVVGQFGGAVSVLRATDGFHVMTPTVGGVPQGIAFDGANMWVTDGPNNMVSVLRASDGSHVMTASTGSSPYGIAFDGAFMWTANESSNNVSKR